MDKAIVIVFLILILGGIIYVVNSGAIGKGVSGLDSILRTPTSSPAVISPNSSGTGSSSGNQASSSASASTSVPANPINPADIPVGFTASELSPYFHEVRFGGVSPGSGDIYSGGSYGQISLYTSFPQGAQPIDVTGWQIRTNRGGEYVPQAINIYDPSGLTLPTDIMFANGQNLYIYSWPGPFNLRLNECIGYIAVQDKFTPSLPNSCPSVDRSVLSKFTGACQNFVESIGNCQTPNLNTLQFPQSDYACLDFIEANFNYRSCFNAHENDANFLSNQWWVWMGSSPLDQYHDNVYLYDRQGLLVDTYSY